jgi:hypothetical protein
MATYVLILKDKLINGLKKMDAKKKINIIKLSDANYP